MGRVRSRQGRVGYVVGPDPAHCHLMFGSPADALVSYPRETATHLALSALFALEGNRPGSSPTVEGLRQEVQRIVGEGVELPEALDHAIGELYVPSRALRQHLTPAPLACAHRLQSCPTQQPFSEAWSHKKPSRSSRNNTSPSRVTALSISSTPGRASSVHKHTWNCDTKHPPHCGGICVH